MLCVFAHRAPEGTSAQWKGQRGWERSEHLGEVTARREEEEEGQQKAQGSAQVLTEDGGVRGWG